MASINLRLSLGIQTAIFVSLGYGLWTISGRDSSTFVNVSWREISLGLAIGSGLIAAMEALFRGFPEWGEKIVRLQVHQLTVFGYPLSPAAIVFIAACAGMGEEALFRAGLQPLATDHLPAVLAVVLASIPFTLVHASKPLVAVAQFVIGCLLGSAFFYTGSLLSVMIGHAVYDVFALWRLQREIQRLDLIDPTVEDPKS